MGPIQPAPGIVIAGKYKLVSLIGEGGMGSVWLAENGALGNRVAIKLMRATQKRDPARARIRFENEARAAAAIRSAHVVQIFDYGIDGDTPYIVMERLVGESLHERLARKGRLSAVETEVIIRHVARALQKAHTMGLVHRDLKPGNIFLAEEDGNVTVKLLDFGVVAEVDGSNVLAQSAHTDTGTVVGTLHYMAPEQLAGTDIDHRVDLFALGAIAYRCLVGHEPFRGDALAELVMRVANVEAPLPTASAPDLSRGFDHWFTTACAKDPAGRYQSAELLSGALRTVLLEQPSLSTAPEHDQQQLSLPPQISDRPKRVRGSLEPTRNDGPSTELGDVATPAPQSYAERLIEPLGALPLIDTSLSWQQTKARSGPPMWLIGALIVALLVGGLALALRSPVEPAAAAPSVAASTATAPRPSMSTDAPPRASASASAFSPPAAPTPVASASAQAARPSTAKVPKSGDDEVLGERN